MQIIKTVKDMQSLGGRLRLKGKTAGFVPTMGALHEGHLSLVRRSKEDNDFTCVSIYVNPMQFGPGEDLNKYPRDTRGDIEKLSASSTDAVFIPDDTGMYPDGFSTTVNVGGTGDRLCGATRPGHFNGVATVVSKLFNIVMPHKAYFGQKDFQQTVIIKKMVRELNFGVDIVVCPTVREPDGLAMSSRNSYLSRGERKAAVILYKSLRHGISLAGRGVDDAASVRGEMEMIIKSEPLAAMDYVQIVDPETLEETEKIKKPAVICLAARIGTTRLIDNMTVP